MTYTVVDAEAAVLGLADHLKHSYAGLTKQQVTRELGEAQRLPPPSAMTLKGVQARAPAALEGHEEEKGGGGGGSHYTSLADDSFDADVKARASMAMGAFCLDSKGGKNKGVGPAGAFGMLRQLRAKSEDKAVFMHVRTAVILDYAVLVVEEADRRERSAVMPTLASNKQARRTHDVNAQKELMLAIVREFLMNAKLAELKWLDYILTGRADGKHVCDSKHYLKDTRRW